MVWARWTLLAKRLCIPFAVLVAACSRSTPPAPSPPPCPTNGLPEEPPPSGLVLPTARGIPILPLPIPTSERGRTVVIRLVIDTAGRAFRDSITVCGVRDSRYADAIARTMVNLPFAPARRDGAPVVWPARIVARTAQ
jgi:hypothetical protein